MQLQPKALYAFGDFQLDPSEQLLCCQGKSVAVTPKAFELLVYLVQNRGRLVTKDELMRSIWPESFVEEANLSVNISALRRALGDSPEGRKFIETVPKRGYRFTAAVTELPTNHGQAENVVAPVELLKASQPSHSIAEQPKPDTRFGKLSILAIALAIVLVALGVWARKTTHLKTTRSTPRRLAILPFRNIGQSADNDFLGFSLADAVISKLGYVSELTVRPSYAVEKYRNQPVEIPRAASELNVDTLLTGSFVQEGDSLRINCQLVDVRTESLLWKGTFDLKYDKLLTVQDKVAQEVISGLALSLSPAEEERLQPGAPLEPVAYEYYLRGVDLYSRSDFPLAIKMLERSAELSPGYALTWAYLGRSYNASASFQFGGKEYYQKAEAAFQRALQLQPSQIESRVYMANLFTDTGRVERAVPLLREALKTNPNHAEIHWELGYAYRFGGMLRESVAECEHARQLDPGVKLNSSALNGYLYLGQYDKFLESLPPGDDLALITFYRGFGELYRNNPIDAARHFDRAYEVDHTLLHAQIGKALSYSLTRQYGEGLAIVRRLENTIRDRGVGDPEAIYKLAQAYALLDDPSSAVRVLRHSVESGFYPYPYLQSDPLLNSIRSDPDFEPAIALARDRHEAFRKLFFSNQTQD
jgi:DNA-binding winged helix-turn-helix (wHTH) protein/TolB-like protein